MRRLDHAAWPLGWVLLVPLLTVPLTLLFYSLLPLEPRRSQLPVIQGCQLIRPVQGAGPVTELQCPLSVSLPGLLPGVLHLVPML
jgi:hypothetical protein